jgi:hypothetical protein
MWTMPKVEIDYTINIGSLINAALLLAAMIGGSFAYFSDQKIEGLSVKTLQQQVQSLQSTDAQITSKITEAQTSTTNRLSTLEAQNVFIIRSLDRVETAIRGKL